DRLHVPATFFTPGHTADSFPDVVGEIHDRGYEIQHHGWSHTNPREFEDKAAEKADIARGIDSIRDVTGQRPTGYRSPAWDFSANTLEILQELDFQWDSSQMGRDFEPYYLREGWRADPERPYERGDRTDVLEIPVAWDRDDWPHLQQVPGSVGERGTPNERDVFERWRRQFDWMYDNLSGGVFPLTMHPQVIGHPPRVAELEALIRHMRSKPGVEFRSYGAVPAMVTD
ncbi:MAG: polysaccharide deacetylase family protein, partial [Halobacteriota archaeon]